jgi:hypothetical protein
MAVYHVNVYQVKKAPQPGSTRSDLFSYPSLRGQRRKDKLPAPEHGMPLETIFDIHKHPAG